MNKHLWLCCREELMVRLTAGGGGGGTSLGALGESCSTWALRVTSQQRGESHLLNYVKKQRESTSQSLTELVGSMQGQQQTLLGQF